MHTDYKVYFCSFTISIITLLLLHKRTINWIVQKVSVLLFENKQ